MPLFCNFGLKRKWIYWICKDHKAVLKKSVLFSCYYPLKRNSECDLVSSVLFQKYAHPSATSIPVRSVVVVTIHHYISEHSLFIIHLVISHDTAWFFGNTEKIINSINLKQAIYFFPLVGLGLLIHTIIHTGLQGKNSLPCLHIKNASVSTVKWCYHEAWVTAHKVYWWRDSHF